MELHRNRGAGEKEVSGGQTDPQNIRAEKKLKVPMIKKKTTAEIQEKPDKSSRYKNEYKSS